MFNKHGGYYGKGKVIDYSININPYGVSPKLKEALYSEIDNMDRYPEINAETTVEKIAERLNMSKENIIVGNGATELIYLFSKAIGFEGKNSVILEPTFTEYQKSVELSGGSVHHVLNKREILDAVVQTNAKSVYICSPNNPDGKVLKYEELKKMLQYIEEKNLDTYIFLDESFIEFSEYRTAEDLVHRYRLFILKSVTKIYGIPGIRIGYGVGHSEIIEKMNMLKEPWTVNSLAIKSMEIFLEDSEYIEMTRTWFREEKSKFLNLFRDIDEIELGEMNANYLIFKMLKGSGKNLMEFLLERGFYIRLCGDFYSLDDNYIRVALRFREQNEKLAAGIKEYFHKLREVKNDE